MKGSLVKAGLFARVVVMGLLVPMTSKSQESSISLIVDQDTFYSKYNEDRNYTMGVGARWVSAGVQSSGITDPLLTLDQVLWDWVIMGDNRTESHGVVLGSTTFTPEDLANPEPIPNDRPYASLLYASTFVQRSDDATNPGKSFTTELTFGILGLRISEDVQTWIHSGLREVNGGQGRPDPEGWPNQISDGGEPTAMYRAAYDGLLWHCPAGQNRDWLQIIPGIEFGVGYYTYAEAGGLIRLGWMRENYLHAGSFMEPIVPKNVDQNVGYARLMASPPAPSWTDALDCFIFAKASGYGTLYNVMLQGQFMNDNPVEVDSSDVERLVGETQLGARLACGKFSVQYSVHRRTSEFESDLSRAHYWGSASLSYQTRF